MLNRKYSKIKFLLIVALSTIFLAQSVDVFAKPRSRPTKKVSRQQQKRRIRTRPRRRRIGSFPRNRGFRRRPRSFISFSIGNTTFSYGTRLFYPRVIDRYVVVQPTVGTLVTRLPFGYDTIFVDGEKYYYDDGIYYKRYRSRYMVVLPPVISGDGTVVVNIPNSKGGYIPVELEKTEEGYLGPQGELYTDNPTVEQLTALYGK